MTAHSIETRAQRASLPRTPLIALAALIAVAAAFAVAFLLAHHGAPKPAAAKVVHATIAPGPSAPTLKKAFATPTLHALIKPVVHKKPKPKPKPTPAASSSDAASSAATSPASSDTYTPPASTPAYTPPAASSDSSPATSPAPKKKSAPSGGGVITIG